MIIIYNNNNNRFVASLDNTKVNVKVKFIIPSVDALRQSTDMSLIRKNALKLNFNSVLFSNVNNKNIIIFLSHKSFILSSFHCGIGGVYSNCPHTVCVVIFSHSLVVPPLLRPLSLFSFCYYVISGIYIIHVCIFRMQHSIYVAAYKLAAIFAMATTLSNQHKSIQLNFFDLQQEEAEKKQPKNKNELFIVAFFAFPKEIHSNMCL